MFLLPSLFSELFDNTENLVVIAPGCFCFQSPRRPNGIPLVFPQDPSCTCIVILIERCVSISLFTILFYRLYIKAQQCITTVVCITISGKCTTLKFPNRNNFNRSQFEIREYDACCRAVLTDSTCFVWTGISPV